MHAPGRAVVFADVENVPFLVENGSEMSDRSGFGKLESAVIFSLSRGALTMEPMKPKLPGEAIQLYNLFIHGEISRREFVASVQRFAVGGLTAATIIEALMPNYALGQQVSRTDDRINATYETVSSPQGNGIIKGYLVRPVSADTRSAMPAKLPGSIVIHENRGLNPHIEDIARRLALANFMAFAPDALYPLGALALYILVAGAGAVLLLRKAAR